MRLAKMCSQRGRDFACLRQILRAKRNGGDALVAATAVLFRERS
jgi:hypothetical protein